MMGHGLTSFSLKVGQGDLVARTRSPSLREGEGGGEHLWIHVRTVNGWQTSPVLRQKTYWRGSWPSLKRVLDLFLKKNGLDAKKSTFWNIKVGIQFVTSTASVKAMTPTFLKHFCNITTNPSVIRIWMSQPSSTSEDDGIALNRHQIKPMPKSSPAVLCLFPPVRIFRVLIL